MGHALVAGGGAGGGASGAAAGAGGALWTEFQGREAQGDGAADE